MHELLERFSKSEVLPALAESLAAGTHTGISGVVGAARSMLAADVAQRLGRTVVLVPDDAHTARALHLDLSVLAPDLDLLLFEPDSPRLPAQLAAVGSGPAVIVASAESLNRPAPDWGRGSGDGGQGSRAESRESRENAGCHCWLVQQCLPTTETIRSSANARLRFHSAVSCCTTLSCNAFH